MNKYKSVAVFLVYRDEVLMLNRNKKFWMGMWNCVGGKIENGETHLETAIRETYEETGILVSEDKMKYLAELKWYFEDDEADGGYCYLAYLDKKYIETPIMTDEGVLDWKKISWVLDKNNRGIVPDIFELLPNMLSGTFSIVSAYYDKEDHLIKVESKHNL